MKSTNLYEVINKKDDSFEDFIRFIDFMFKYKDKKEVFKHLEDRKNFDYHFNKIPEYLRDMFQYLRYSLIGDISNISVTTMKLSERVDKFTDME